MTKFKSNWVLIGLVSFLVMLIILIVVSNGNFDFYFYNHPTIESYLRVFVVFCLCLTAISVVMYYFWPDKEEAQRREHYRQQYIKCLQSQDKSNAVYWGKLFYDYGSCYTIHQQNNVQLQIQNDILSYSK
jgi:uncharacterized membrane protein